MRVKKIVIPVIIIAALAAGLVYIRREEKPAETSYRIEPFRDDIFITVSASGFVRPRNRLEVKPPLSGRIEEILVREGDRLEAGQIIAWMSSSERAALLDAARSRGESELRRWEEIYRPTPVIAPLKGFVIKREMEAGQTIGSQDPVIVMADELIIRAQVDETDLRNIDKGQSAEITLDAFPGNTIEGVIEHISYESEVVSNVTVYNVDIRPLQGRGLMRSGMNAMVQAQIEKSENALLIPSSAIIQRGEEKFVEVLDPGNNNTRMRRIETGISDGSNTEVVSGLDDEDVLVVSLQARQGSRSRFRGGLPGMGN